jgi:hypothetical protein
VGRQTVKGNFTPRFFKETSGGELVVVGKVTAQLERANGTVIREATERQRLTVLNAPGAGADAARAAATCDILNLVLGPLDLNLLGLEISLNRVVLDIVAVTGAGNLLGNLLCAVAGLLDGGLPGLLGEISNILNSILAILRL